MAGLTVLDERHKRVAELLLRGTPRTEIAAKESVNRTTIYKWIRDPLFQAYYEALGDEVESSRVTRLIPVADSAAEAVGCALLNAIKDMKDPDPLVRSSAPGLQVLSHALKTVIELERVSLGRPGTISEKRDGKSKTEELGPRAKKLLESLDKWTDAEGTAAVPESSLTPASPEEVN